MPTDIEALRLTAEQSSLIRNGGLKQARSFLDRFDTVDDLTFTTCENRRTLQAVDTENKLIEALTRNAELHGAAETVETLKKQLAKAQLDTLDATMQATDARKERDRAVARNSMAVNS